MVLINATVTTPNNMFHYNPPQKYTISNYKKGVQDNTFLNMIFYPIYPIILLVVFQFVHFFLFVRVDLELIL